MKVVWCALDKRVDLARFDNDDIASVESYRGVAHDNCAAAPGDEVDLAQLTVIVPLVDALIRKADERQRRVGKLTILAFGGSGCVVPRNNHGMDSSW